MPPSTLPKISSRIKFGLVLAVIVVIAAIGLQITTRVTTPPAPPLLTQEQTMIRLTNISDVATYVDTPVIEPKKRFDSTLQVIGVYPEDNAFFPKNTVDLVYVKNGFRFVDISFRPNTSVDKEHLGFGTAPYEEVTLTKDTKALLITARPMHVCRKPSGDGIGVCQITKVLLFKKDDIVIAISIDGKHASDGEVIEMARSMFTES